MEQRRPSHDRFVFIGFFVILEIVILIILGCCFEFDGKIRPGTFRYSQQKIFKGKEMAKEEYQTFYGIFQDVNVMVFIGFGFLYTYLRYHTLSSIMLNLLLGVFAFEFSIICQGFFQICFEDKNDKWQKIAIDYKSMIEGDFAAAAVLISYGAMMGKATFLQLIFMTAFEVIVYSLNFRLGEVKLHATDAGGSMFIHSFGAFFGVACAWVLYYDKSEKINNHPCNKSNKMSNTFAFIGTIFLWMFWPSFNTALITDDQRYRGIINTIFAMGGSCLGAFVTSYIAHGSKLEPETILNASVAGGVFIGGSCNIILVPFASIVIGIIGGVISALFFEFVSKSCVKCNLHDTAGILYLHGFPGLLGSIITAICVAAMTESRWNSDWDKIKTNCELPKNMSRPFNLDHRYNLYDFSEYISNCTFILDYLSDIPFKQSGLLYVDLERINKTDDYIFKDSTARSAGKQAGYQILVEVITFALGAVGGVLCGFSLKCGFCGDNPDYFIDEAYWVEEEEEEVKTMVPKPTTGYVVANKGSQNVEMTNTDNNL